MKNFRRRMLFILALSIVTIIFSCKDDKDNFDRGGYVNVTINLNDPSSVQLNSIGGYIYFTGADAGLKGLIIYRRSLDGADAFATYDRACSYDPDAACKLIVDASGVTATDSCCGSQFEIYYGSVTKQPATQPLIGYKTERQGNYLYIRNF